MEVAGHEGVVRGAEPALARSVGSIVCWVVRLPDAAELARQTQIVSCRKGQIAPPCADPPTEKRFPMRVDEGPPVLNRRGPHDVIETLGKSATFPGFFLAQLKVRDDVHAGFPTRTYRHAIVQQREAGVGGEDDPIALFPGDVQDVAKGAV